MNDLEGFRIYEPGESMPEVDGVYEVLWHFNGRDAIYGGTADWKNGMWYSRDTPGGAVIVASRLKEAAHA